mmetsp:Transcript_10130/g.25486  ORF Transcript_10130/g.25486 Transcript_10130/m.25486 type:complete len:200 (+) Transcript_10130:86-685(+)
MYRSTININASAWGMCSPCSVFGVAVLSHTLSHARAWSYAAEIIVLPRACEASARDQTVPSVPNIDFLMTHSETVTGRLPTMGAALLSKPTLVLEAGLPAASTTTMALATSETCVPGCSAEYLMNCSSRGPYSSCATSEPSFMAHASHMRPLSLSPSDISMVGFTKPGLTMQQSMGSSRSCISTRMLRQKASIAHLDAM